VRIDLPLRFRIVSGLIAIVVMLCFAVVVVNYGNGYFDPGYKLTAVFDRSTPGLYPGSTVKVRGISIGTVNSIKLQPDGRALVTLFMKPDSKVADTAVASIEPLSIFGPKYVNIQQGAHELTGGYLATGAAIKQTTAPLEFTETLAKATALFSKIDTKELITVLHAVADGVSGMGPNIASTIDNTKTLTDVIAKHTGDTDKLLTDLATVTAALASRGDELTTTAANLNQVLPEIASQPDRVSALLDGITKVSKQVADVIGNPAFDPTVSGLSELIGTINAQRQNVPALLDALNLFFGELSDIIRVAGPDSVLMGALRGQASNDLCAVVVGSLSCPVGP
jgi:phospholipid/cholesterol/gamma-HCH transport system substrate-binding protein